MLALVLLACCQICLCAECAWRKIQRPDYLCSWVDLKQLFGATYKQRGNLRTCVEAAGAATLAATRTLLQACLRMTRMIRAAVQSPRNSSALIPVCSCC